jgi:hypothetical protein
MSSGDDRGGDAMVFSARARPVVGPGSERTYAGESDDPTVIPARFAGAPGNPGDDGGAGGGRAGGVTIAGGLSFAVLAIAAMLVVALVMALAAR